MMKFSFHRIQVLLPWLICPALLLLLVECKKKPPPPAPAPPRVTITQPVRQMVTDYLELTGNTQAVNTVQLVARVAGYLEKVLFQDGQMVKKGQLLFLIQKDAYENALTQAEGQIMLYKAQAAYAEKEWVRYTHLLRQKAASREIVDNWRYQRDSALANLKIARAARNLAKLNLDYTEVSAPFDGRIDRRLVDPGNLVGASGNTVLSKMNQLDPIYVYFTISDLDLARLVKAVGGHPGQGEQKDGSVFSGLPDEQDYPHQGRLDFSSISLTPTTGTLLMRGVFPNPDGKILPGLYARVHVPLEKKSMLMIPEEAVGSDQQGTYVYIVNEKDAVERRGVTIGPLVDHLRAIEAGLEAKEWVIYKGLLKALPGKTVTPEQHHLPSADGSPPAPRYRKVSP